MRVLAHLPRLSAACLAAALLLPGLALAQGTAAPPAEIGNRANGLDYQPTQGGVATKEERAGIAPSTRQQQSTTSEVERLNQQLQNAENNDPQIHPRGQGKVDPNR